MKCPYCSCPNTKVTDSRDTDDGASIRRRRQCLECGRRFTTYETVEEVPLRVVKKNGIREMFDRNKLRNGLIRACEKRNISSRQIEDIVDEVERSIRNRLIQEVPSDMLGEMVMGKLKHLDQVAYVRFASVYRQFTDIGNFMKELKSLMDTDKPGRSQGETGSGGQKEKIPGGKEG